MMNRVRLFFAFVLLAGSGAANALGAFSRACNFAEIPKIMQRPAAYLFYSLGAPESLKDMHQSSDRAAYWIFEAITADYGLLRYYLYAEAFVYEYSFAMGQWRQLRSYSSGSVKAQKLDDSITSFQLYKDMFFHNRQFMFSARAGELGIYSKPLNPANLHRVYGRHAYFEPKTNRLYALSNTHAWDCNLSEWGFGVR